MPRPGLLFSPPPNCISPHPMLTTRVDPGLRLAHLRARDQLTEFRTADLPFTPTETTAFFNQLLGLDLSFTDAAALEDHTGGWIA